MQFLLQTDSLSGDPLYSRRYNVVDDLYRNVTTAVTETVIIRGIGTNVEITTQKRRTMED